MQIHRYACNTEKRIKRCRHSDLHVKQSEENNYIITLIYMQHKA